MRILIIGKNSYIGTNIKQYLQKYDFEVDEYDAEHESINYVLFSRYDVVIHVAAIVHRKDIQDWNVYKEVNVDFPIQTALLAKSNGVRQFIFLSSMAVYGVEKNLRKHCVVDKDTECKPRTMYGRSKLEAEHGIRELQSEKFTVSIIRPANVYGKGCKGNYIKKFCKITKRLPLLPDVYRNVKQGFLYVDNLCEMVRLLIEGNFAGVFPAQDREMVSSIELMEKISNVLKLRKKSSKLFGYVFHIVRNSLVDKLFGGVVYDETYCKFLFGDYQINSFDEGIKFTLEGDLEI